MDTNTKVLRKLEIGEILKNNHQIASNVFTNFRLRSRIDLFAHLDQLKTALHTWKSTQNLLRAKVAKNGDEDYFFVIDENSSANTNLENIHFLRIKSNLDSDLNKVLIDDNLVLDLALDKCLSELINFDNNPELLWKMLIIEVKKNGNDFFYELIWQIHHAISDGISIKENFLFFLDIVHRTILSKPIDVSESVLYAGTMKIFEKEMSTAPGFPIDIPKLIKPSFLDTEKSRQDLQSKYDKLFTSQSQLDLLELFDLNTNQRFAKITELILAAKDINQNPEKFEIEEIIWEKFLKKSKNEGIKLTSCINMIITLSIFRLYKKHNLNMDYNIHYDAVSLRQFRPSEELDNFQLGYCVSALFTSIPNSMMNPDDDSEIRAKFWPLAREHAREFDHRVKNDDAKFFKPQFVKYDDDQLLVHTSLSNIGIIDDSKYECFGNNQSGFTIENVFYICNYPKWFCSMLIGLFACTVGNKLCCCLSNNGLFFGPRETEEFRDIFKNIFELII